MAAFATPSDVEAAWRSLTAPERLLAANHLSFASAIIRSMIVDVDTRITAGALDADLVKHVAVSMVVRHMRNPDGARVSEQRAIDDYSETTTRTPHPASASGGLFLTDEELALLGKRGSGAFSIRPGPEPTTCAIAERAAINQASWRN